MDSSLQNSRKILDASQIEQKIIRIAHEIYEHNFSASQLILAGIEDQGYALAKRIASVIDQISHFNFEQHSLELVSIKLEKFTDTQCNVSLSCPQDHVDGKSIVLVDDVLNTGRTLAYSMRPFLERDIQQMEIAVLVNRSHSKFPMVATYAGYELATTLEEHIEVVLSSGEEAVYLS